MSSQLGAPYDQMYLHRYMLRDEVRVSAFKKALDKAIRPGDVVIDVGAGTGILGFLAIQAGARRVYMIEPTHVANTARELARQNGWADRVEVINATVDEAEIEERADVIVFEWLGAAGNDENMFSILLQARDKWLKPGGKILPRHVSTWLAPAFDEEVEQERKFWHAKPYGVDLSMLWGHFNDEFRYASHHVTEKHLMAEKGLLWEHDADQDSLDRAKSAYENTVEFSAVKDGLVNSLAFWFYAQLHEDVYLTNAPWAPPTHWGRLVLPLDKAYPVRAREIMTVRFTARPGGSGYSNGGYSFRLGNGEWERHLEHQ